MEKCAHWAENIMLWLWNFQASIALFYETSHLLSGTQSKSKQRARIIYTNNLTEVCIGQKLCTESSCHLLPKGSDHSGDDMQGLGYVRENTQPVALLSSLSVTPYNPPFKEMSSFMVPSALSKSTPLRSLQLKHTTKPPSADIGRPFLSVSPSFHLSDCLPVL